MSWSASTSASSFSSGWLVAFVRRFFAARRLDSGAESSAARGDRTERKPQSKAEWRVVSVRGECTAGMGWRWLHPFIDGCQRGSGSGVEWSGVEWSGVGSSTNCSRGTGSSSRRGQRRAQDDAVTWDTSAATDTVMRTSIAPPCPSASTGLHLHLAPPSHSAPGRPQLSLFALSGAAGGWR